MCDCEKTKENVKLMDLDEFKNEGYLQEVNRQFFHPLGVALALHYDDDSKEISLCVWDSRDNPDGIVFHPDVVDDDMIEKADKILHLKNERESKRITAFGYVVQPVI